MIHFLFCENLFIYIYNYTSNNLNEFYKNFNNVFLIHFNDVKEIISNDEFIITDIIKLDEFKIDGYMII